MITILALVVRIVANPLANVFQKKAVADGLCAARVNCASYVLLAIITLPLFVSFEYINLKFLLLCAVSGLMGALSNYFLIRALELADLSVLGPINSYNAIIGIVFAIVLLGEYPDVYGLIGVLLIVCGSYFIVDSGGRFCFSMFKNKGIRYRFYALFLAGIEAVLLKKIILCSSVEVGFSAWALGGALFSLPLVIISKNKSSLSVVHAGCRIFLIALLFGAMQLSTNYVFEYVKVGYALALFQLSGVLSVVFGWLFFGEKNIVKKLIGAVMMSIGAGAIVL